MRLPSWLGDTIMAIPTLRALGRACDHRPVFWGSSRFGQLLEAVGVEGETIGYRRRRGPGGVSDAIRTVAEVRHRRFDLALLLPNAFEAALLARLAGIPRRIGYAADGRATLLTDPVAPPLGPPPHLTERYARLLNELGVEPPTPEDGVLEPTPELASRATGLLPEGDFVGLVPGSANSPAKRWAAESYAEIARRAEADWGARAVLIGSEADRSVAGQIAEASDAATIDLTGCDIVDLAAALWRCRVVISNDTGAAHLSAALGRPTAVLFGPTDPARSGPRGPRVMPLSAGSFCQPCEADECPLDGRCMAMLTPEMVFESAEALWNGG